MKITKNSISDQEMEQFVNLLKQGFNVQECLSYLYALNHHSIYLSMKTKLDEGNDLNDVLLMYQKDALFCELFKILYPLKGLLLSLKDTMEFVKLKNKWMKLIKKQLGYPMMLMVLMIGFSIFVQAFLLPEMERLFISFQMGSGQLALVSLIGMLPTFFICVFAVILLCVFCISVTIIQGNEKAIRHYLQIPLIQQIIKTYYALKFSYFFSLLSSYFDSFYDTIDYLYKSSQKTDMRIVYSDLYYKLSRGEELSYIIQQSPYFTYKFIHFFNLISQSKQSFQTLETYCDLTFMNIEKGLMRLTRFILALIYLIIGLYVLCLYSLMILPILEITTTF